MYSARKSFYSNFTSIVATFKNCVDHALVFYYTQKILKNFAVAYDQEINYIEHKKILTILMMRFFLLGILFLVHMFFYNPGQNILQKVRKSVKLNNPRKS